MTTQYLVKMNDSFVEQLKNFAKEMGEELSIMAFDEKKYIIKKNELPPFNQALEKLPKADDNEDFFVRDYVGNDKMTLEDALLSIPKLDVEDDFFNSCKK